MSILLSFLCNRQIDGKQQKRGLHSSCYKLDFDDQLSRLVSYGRDVFPTYIQNYPIPPFVCKFRKDRGSDLLALANEEGEILLIDTERSKIVKTFIAHENAVFDICWMPDKNHMLTVSGDHSARLFDMNTCQFISSYHGHSASIKSVDVCHSDSAVFATGSRDGHICIWDKRERCGVKNSKPSNFIFAAHSRLDFCKKKVCNLSCNNLSSVSAVAFQDSTHLVSSGVADGLIKVWDLRRTYIKTRTYSPRYQMEYSSDKASGHGCSSLVFDSSHKKLYASITSNKIYQFDCHTYSNKAVIYTGFKCNTYFIKLDLSCDDQYLLGGSSNHKAYIWKTSKPGAPILALPGHRAEVTSVAWSPYSIMKLATVGDDHKLLIWRIQNTDDADSDAEHKALSENIVDEEEESLDSPSIALSSLSTPFHPQRRNNSSQNPKTPNIRSITNFYSPLTPSSSLQDATPEKLTSPESQNQPLSKDSAISPHLRSPCKTMSDNDLALSVDSSVDPKSSPNGKENSTLLTARDDPSSALKTPGPLKRKLNAPKSTICRYHPGGCGRTKGHSRCGKRIVLTPDRHNIKKYFSVSPPE